MALLYSPALNCWSPSTRHIRNTLSTHKQPISNPLATHEQRMSMPSDTCWLPSSRISSASLWRSLPSCVCVCVCVCVSFAACSAAVSAAAGERARAQLRLRRRPGPCGATAVGLITALLCLRRCAFLGPSLSFYTGRSAGKSGSGSLGSARGS